MRRHWTSGICACLLGALVLTGCGSNTDGGGSPDARQLLPIDTRPAGESDAPLAGNDAAYAGLDGGVSVVDAGTTCGSLTSSAAISDCIVNPHDGRGGGSIVTRQNPVAYGTCRAQ